ncbi:hypothetical protein, partial [Dokdonella sp.]|uniref:hypothetical protein n=1 Tax=Dokdonella sp. TaxID=2291710 RepID=UPI0025C4A9CC
MFLDGALDHLALDGQRIDITPGLARCQVDLATRYPQFQRLRTTSGTDLVDATVLVHCAPGFLLQIESVHDGDFLAADTAAHVHIELD